MPRKPLTFVVLMSGLLVATALAFGGFSSPASADPQIDSEELAFVALINNYRAENGLGSLSTTPTLNNAADWMSADMGINSYFNHYDACTGDCINGHQRDTTRSRSPWTRMCNFGYCPNTWMGENIAAGYTSAQAVFTAWKDSPGHNANMLGANYRVIGIARVYVSGSPYGYYWTNDFGGIVPTGGAPASTATASPTRSPTPSPTRSATPTPFVTQPPAVTPTRSPTPSPTRSPAPPAVLPATPPTSPTPTPRPVVTARPTASPRIIHDVAVTHFSVGDVASSGETKPIVIRLTNYGTQTEDATYGIAAKCLDGNNSKIMECGSLQYAPECFGSVALAAGKMVEVRCSVTYTGGTYHDRWSHRVTVTAPGDTRPSNDWRILERRVW